MTFHSMLRDVKSLSRKSFEVILNGHQKGKSHGCLHLMQSEAHVNQKSCWANLPPELLCDVIKRLEESERTWPSRKHVVACAAVCRSWRSICKQIVRSPELCGVLTFPASLKQPGTRDGTVQCFIKRDKTSFTYHLFLSLSPVLVENGKFLLSAKKTRRTTLTEYIISMDADNISRSSSGYIGKLRSNFLGTKFVIYDTQPPYCDTSIPAPGRPSRRFNSNKVSPKVPTASYNTGQISYDVNMIGARGPRRMHCIMQSIPASATDVGGTVACKPELLQRQLLKGSFRSFSFPGCLNHHPAKLFCSNASQITSDEPQFKPLVLKNKPPRWHEQLQCWCLNFRGRVTMASVKNFQLLAVTEPAPASSSQPASYEYDKIILQFGKVGRDLFTMDYCYPLSAFQAFAICLSSFDNKLACE